MAELPPCQCEVLVSLENNIVVSAWYVPETETFVVSFSRKVVPIYWAYLPESPRIKK